MVCWLQADYLVEYAEWLMVCWLQADYLAEYAEWLISSGQNDGDTAEDVLLAAADALLEFDVGEGGLRGIAYSSMCTV